MFSTFDDLAKACSNLPSGSQEAAGEAATRQDLLTKPQGSLGKLEELAIWLARWQGRAVPELKTVDMLVFAGSHGVTAKGVSAFPAEVTAQMVANFEAGGAAINQLAKHADAKLKVTPISVDRPTGDFTETAAMSEEDFLEAVCVGFRSVNKEADLICLGEMGIGNTTAAAAVCAGLFGGTGADWVGRGTGVDDEGLARKAGAVDAALKTHSGLAGDPVRVMAALGGRELAAMFGAALAARHHETPVMLDGYVCTAAVAGLGVLDKSGLDHTRCAHRSAEQGHDRLLNRLGLDPLFDLGMRLGEGSGACLAINVLRAAVACHAGMASFADAGVSTA